MSKMAIFITGTFVGFLLCKLSSVDRIVCGMLAIILLLILGLGYLFHLGISDFQEFEG